jgi:hypothetical protein
MCAGKDHLLRVRPFIIARRYNYPVPQIAQPPAHNAILRDIRTLMDPTCDLPLLFVRQLRLRTAAVRPV